MLISRTDISGIQFNSIVIYYITKSQQQLTQGAFSCKVKIL